MKEMELFKNHVFFSFIIVKKHLASLISKDFQPRNFELKSCLTLTYDYTYVGKKGMKWYI